ncbi:trypsin eta-like [Haematobia irritans]|uniref:trypsin eta-like n=1 Tax=Haematobia irritans TaxID=7368 RepID=UPI003F501C4F
MGKYQQGLIAYCCLLQMFMALNALPSTWESRIINGSDVNWDDTRYQVSLRNKYIDDMFFGAGHLCGGTLVARNLVLTASHCIWDEHKQKFRNASEFVITMGNVDRTKKSGSLKLQVREIITGPNFNPTTYRDDIAIVILDDSVPLNYLRASIMEVNENAHIEAGTKCTVSGWGITEKGSYSKRLRSLEAPVIDREVCVDTYGSDTIFDGMMCAGYLRGGRDACLGDSGGPLICDNKLVGIVSFGIGCALPKYPGVYTNVSYYIEWFRNRTASIEDRGINEDVINNLTMINAHISSLAPNDYSRQFTWFILALFSIFSKIVSSF